MLGRSAKAEDRGVRDILDTLAKDDLNDPAVTNGYAPPKIRTLSRMANEVADEHGIAQPGQSDAMKALEELGQNPPPIAHKKSLAIIESTPLEDLARILNSFTYGTMMQLVKELKAVEHANFETPEGVAALLHSWASTTLSAKA